METADKIYKKHPCCSTEKKHGESLNDEPLRTLLVEIEGIINSRLITCNNIGDANNIVPLNPIQ